MESQSSIMLFFEILLLLFGVDQAGLPPGAPDPVVQRAAAPNALIRSDWTAPSAGDHGAPGIDGFFGDVEIKTFQEAMDRAHRDRTKEIIADFGESFVDWGNPEALLFRVKLLRHVVVRHAGSFWLEPTPAFDQASVEKAKLATEDENAYPVSLIQVPHAWRVSSLVMLVRAGTDADRLQRIVEVCLGLPEEMPTGKPGGFRKALLEGPLQITFHRDGENLWLAVGETALRQAIERARSESPAANQSPTQAPSRYEQAVGSLGVSRVGVTQFIDFHGLRKLLAQVDDPRAKFELLIADLAGLKNMDTLATATGITNGALAQRGRLSFIDKPSGLWESLETTSLTAKDFERVPADAELVAAIKLSPARWLGSIRKTMTAGMPGGAASIEELLKQVNTELGVMVEEDLLSAFGDTWILTSSSAHGSFLGGGVVGSWEVRDPRKAVAAFAELMKVVTNSVTIDEESSVRQTEFMDRTIYTIEQNSYSVFRTTWSLCLTDRHLLVSSHPQAIKATLRFIQEGGPNFAQTMADGKSSGGKALPQEGNVLGYLWMDSPQVMRQLVALWPQLSAYADVGDDQFEGESKLQAIDFPSPAAILPYVQPSRATIVRKPKAIEFEVEQPLPLVAILEYLIRSQISQMGFEENW